MKGNIFYTPRPDDRNTRSAARVTEDSETTMTTFMAPTVRNQRRIRFGDCGAASRTAVAVSCQSNRLAKLPPLWQRGESKITSAGLPSRCGAAG